MTAAAERLDVLTILRRAEQRWCQRNADESRGASYIELLAEAVRAHLAASEIDATPSNPDAQRDAVRAVGALEATRRERDDARGERDQARAEVVELTKEVGRLRADYAAVVAEQQRERAERDVERDRDRLAVTAALTERDSLVAELAKKKPHEHRYPWPAPDQPIEPCSCNKPWPGYRQLVDEDVEPDVDPWAELLGRVRDELHDWETRPRNGKGSD